MKNSEQATERSSVVYHISFITRLKSVNSSRSYYRKEIYTWMFSP